MSKRLADRLDWNQMLGFGLVVDSRDWLREGTSQRLGAKVGGKPGLKPGPTIGTKTGAKPVLNVIGVKAGLKPID